MKEILALKEKYGLEYLMELNTIIGVLNQNDQLNSNG
jgi:hypothetical protein